MHAVGHQRIGMASATELIGKVFELVQVELVALFVVAAHGAMIAAREKRVRRGFGNQ